MKKRSLTNLKLKKRVIANFSVTTRSIIGGTNKLGCTLPTDGKTSVKPDVCKITCG